MTARGIRAAWRFQDSEMASKTASKSLNPFQFIREVRQETAKVSWPSRNETLITTVMVLVMVALTAMFFFFVDAILRWVVNLVIYGK